MELFKYLNESRTTVLEDGLIRFTQPASFNDPFELKPEILSLSATPYTQESIERQYSDVFRAVYELLAPEKKSSMSFEQAVASIDKSQLFGSVSSMIGAQTGFVKSKLHSFLGSQIGILSLTENPHNLLMWAHYANEHKGYLIGFDSEHEFFDQRLSVRDHLRCLRKVNYSKNMPILDITRIRSIDELMVKGIDWCYEQEWRMVLDIKDSDKKIESEMDPIHLFRIPFEAFKSLRIGARTRPEIKQLLLDTVGKNSELDHLSIYEMSVHESKYELVETQLK